MIVTVIHIAHLSDFRESAVMMLPWPKRFGEQVSVVGDHMLEITDIQYA